MMRMRNVNTEGILLTYEQLRTISPGISDEALVEVQAFDSTIVAEYEKTDMIAYTGSTMLVRESVARKLARVNASLEQSGYRLKVVYGYRHPEVQEKYFSAIVNELKKASPDLRTEQLEAAAHNFVAVPKVAGHPTGGAVDLTLLSHDNVPLDMGTKIADYAAPELIRTYAPSLTALQSENRKLLLDAMTAEGFAPFYGEWWHFSYGDREWAYFYGHTEALYGGINVRLHS